MSTNSSFLAEANIGPAIARDLELLGISSVPELAAQNPVELYDRLCVITRSRQDPCVLDTFMAIVHNARTGERRMWWTFTAERKRSIGVG